LSDEMKPCPYCSSRDIDPKFWKDGEGNNGPGCMDCGGSTEKIETWENADCWKQISSLESQLCEAKEKLSMAVDDIREVLDFIYFDSDLSQKELINRLSTDLAKIRGGK
jgi:hypothetical protein